MYIHIYLDVTIYTIFTKYTFTSERKFTMEHKYIISKVKNQSKLEAPIYKCPIQYTPFHVQNFGKISITNTTTFAHRPFIRIYDPNTKQKVYPLRL